MYISYLFLSSVRICRCCSSSGGRQCSSVLRSPAYSSSRLSVAMLMVAISGCFARRLHWWRSWVTSMSGCYVWFICSCTVAFLLVLGICIIYPLTVISLSYSHSVHFGSTSNMR